MRRNQYDDDTVPANSLERRLRKRELADQHDIDCGYCRYHKGENATRRSKNADVRKAKKPHRGGVRLEALDRFIELPAFDLDAWLEGLQS